MKKILSVFIIAVLISALFAISSSAMHWSDDECSIDDAGNYHPTHSWGYVFNIDSVNYLEGKTTAIFNNEESYLNIGNAKWMAHVLLAPTEEKNVYTVVKAYEYIGCSASDALSNGMFDFDGGKLLLVASDSGTRPAVDENGDLLFPNWEDRSACWGLVNTIGAKITLTEIDFVFGLMPEDVCTATVENDPSKSETITSNDASENTVSEGTVSEGTPSGDATSEDASNSATEVPTEASGFEKVIQVIFIAIMTVGIVGLPAYYWLNSRRKKALEEYNENQNNGENE